LFERSARSTGEYDAAADYEATDQSQATDPPKGGTSCLGVCNRDVAKDRRAGEAEQEHEREENPLAS